VVDKLLIDLVVPEDRSDTGPAKIETRENPLEYAEYRITRPENGEVRWIARRGEVVRGDERTQRRFIGVCFDITQRRRAEEALRKLNETLEAQVAERTLERDRLWRVSQDLLVVTDEKGVLLSTNPAWEAVLGWTEIELVGNTYHWLVHPDDLFATDLEHARLIGGARAMRFENRMRHKDGSYRWLSWTATPENGRIYSVARDVTSEKAAAEALRATEEALRQAQKMEAVGQLTGGIAHDFNNLLQGIVGSLSVVRKLANVGRTAEIERFVGMAMSSANRAASLTHRLLAFSRRQPLNPRPAEINSLVESMEDLLRRTMGESVEINLVLAIDLWLTLCDHNQLENAILNLAINARDAMPSGGRLTIETCNAHLDDASAAAQRDLAPGQYVCVCVTDTGTGMSPEVLTRAFDPFFTTKPLGQGTGLGLSMIYGFARQSDGHARIYSQQGRGTTVKLYLPRYHGEKDAATAPTPDTSVDLRSAGAETILVVEDELVVRQLIVESLRELGYRTLEAIDGSSGLRILKSSERIDLLVTDIGLPGINGRQLADLARENRPELRVLFMTGYAEAAAFTNGILASGMQMLTKPFAMDIFIARVRSMLEETKSLSA
jgi:PAS domain S-box-containing protein